jgi:hypothetical protein
MIIFESLGAANTRGLDGASVLVQAFLAADFLI